MNDISFNVKTREINMLPDGSDFLTTIHPSVQNGGILLYAQCPNPYLPIYGIGLVPQVIGGVRRDFVYALNRWQQQAYQDGATVAKWTIQPAPSNDESTITEVSYE